MPLQATSGAASYDAFGGGVAVEPVYIEQIFSTFLYTGNGTSQTITNGVDLLGKGGLVWIKSRMPFDASGGVTNHNLITNPAAGRLQSNTTAALGGFGGDGFTSTGFQVSGTVLNSSTSDGTPPNNYASWTFRKQKKFFDVVTYSGSSSTQNIAHNLGSVPGCIIVKRTSGVEDWFVYHTSLGNTQYIKLNTTGAVASGFAAWNNTSPTSTQFTVLGGRTEVNAAGSDYVAYLFAHDAGGFGLTGTDNVISCGSFDGTANTAVTLGYEPQWIMFKNTTSTSNWQIIDNMRGMVVSSDDRQLLANSSNAEGDNNLVSPTATGFTWIPSAAGNTYIYIAIRRGPMKVPTSGTSVFAPLTYTGNGTSGRYISGAGFPPDLIIQTARSASENREFDDRLRGGGSTAMNALFSNSSNAEAANSGSVQLLNQDGFTVRSFGNGSSVTYIGECFRRAPSFFDEVCYSGNSTARTINHNLGVAPELMIVKARSGTNAGSIDWFVYASPLGNSSRLLLNTNGALADGQPVWNSTTPTSSVFSLGTSDNINGTGLTYVNYLFATCAGVSKVGSYTGTGTTKQIDCGFAGGARFVLIKRSDSTGSWYVWDSSRGIVSGNDPYLLLNSTAAEVTNTDYIDTYSAGFEISSTAPSEINASGGTFIFLAIA